MIIGWLVLNRYREYIVSIALVSFTYVKNIKLHRYENQGICL
jgi:hypothetical protein